MRNMRNTTAVASAAAAAVVVVAADAAAATVIGGWIRSSYKIEERGKATDQDEDVCLY
jgi:hypothetical protein